MLDQLLDAPLLEPRAAELAGAERIRYVLDQRFRYEYDAPIAQLHHRLVVLPPVRHGNQFRREHRVDAAGAAVRRRSRADRDGNPVVHFAAPHVEQHVEFRVAAVVDQVHADRPYTVPRAALGNPRWVNPTALTRPDEHIRELARSATEHVADPTERAHALTHATHLAVRYEYGVTDVATTAAQAVRLGRGVCQDSAHVLLAMCHAVGAPARYVSGHLLGQGGTHAWVEILVPRGRAAVALPLDPCNDRPAGAGYLTIATGRDYRAVAPTSGYFSGTSAGRLTATRRVGVVAA